MKSILLHIRQLIPLEQYMPIINVPFFNYIYNLLLLWSFLFITRRFGTDKRLYAFYRMHFIRGVWVIIHVTLHDNRTMFSLELRRTRRHLSRIRWEAMCSETVNQFVDPLMCVLKCQFLHVQSICHWYKSKIIYWISTSNEGNK